LLVGSALTLARRAFGHIDERPVREDHVSRHLALFGKAQPHGFERGEEGGVAYLDAHLLC
jgi:hypothetical protein